MLGRGGGRGKRSLAWLLQAIHVFWKFLSTCSLNPHVSTIFTPKTSPSFLVNLTVTLAHFSFRKRKHIIHTLPPTQANLGNVNSPKKEDGWILKRGSTFGNKTNPEWTHSFAIDFHSQWWGWSFPGRGDNLPRTWGLLTEHEPGCFLAPIFFRRWRPSLPREKHPESSPSSAENCTNWPGFTNSEQRRSLSWNAGVWKECESTLPPREE